MKISRFQMCMFISISIFNSLFLFSCRNQDSRTNLNSISSLLKQQADKWDKAIIQKDSAAVASNMSDDFRHISKRGEISDKGTFLQGILSPDLVINPYTVEEFNIRIYGDCALLSGTTKMNGTYKGESFHSYYRYVDTYIRVNGEWKVCNVQITGLSE